MQTDPPPQFRAIASILIPAHNEQHAIRRLLAQLEGPSLRGEFEVIVLCNGCTDDTVKLARRFEPAIRVVDLPEPSKRAALRHGNLIARAFPRIYLDADVEINVRDLRALVTALQGTVLAAAPTRLIPRDGVSLLVRWYYDVWEQLPPVRTSLFGRGVIALSADGWERLSGLPPLMADDLVVAAAFTSDEVVVLEQAHVIVWPPRRIGDLLRRRVRVRTGNAQFDQQASRISELKTSPGDLARIAKHGPTMAAKVAVFCSVTLVSRLGAGHRVRSRDFTTWLRDESSRNQPERD